MAKKSGSGLDPQRSGRSRSLKNQIRILKNVDLNAKLKIRVDSKNWIFESTLFFN